MIHVIYTCKICDAEIDVEVTIGEENDLPDNCPECNEPIPESAHEEVEELANGKAAHDFEYKDE